MRKVNKLHVIKASSIFAVCQIFLAGIFLAFVNLCIFITFHRLHLTSPLLTAINDQCGSVVKYFNTPSIF